MPLAFRAGKGGGAFGRPALVLRVPQVAGEIQHAGLGKPRQVQVIRR